jgi:hypothetical protein
LVAIGSLTLVSDEFNGDSGAVGSEWILGDPGLSDTEEDEYAEEEEEGDEHDGFYDADDEPPLRRFWPVEMSRAFLSLGVADSVLEATCDFHAIVDNEREVCLLYLVPRRPLTSGEECTVESTYISNVRDLAYESASGCV